jgi:thiosulfate/3-mercaptopyruvate sulfurtransferase
VKKYRIVRHGIIGVLLFMGVLWSLTSAAQKEAGYPNAKFLTNAQWLSAHLKDEDIVIADVRTDEYFNNDLIPGAVRMVWSDFRFNDLGENLASTFVGVKQAQEILGRHGVTRNDMVVLYDSVERDGGATASYVFWILDLLNHEKKMILERGIDGWQDAGFEVVTQPRQPTPLLYQAPLKEIQIGKLIGGDFVYKRLGDYYYQIVDVRSQAEYLGEKGTKGLDGTPLKLGHIPTAVNIHYKLAWTDPGTKGIKAYDDLRTLYKGLDPSKGVIVYCNSGRRSAFSYFILRMIGFENVLTYEPSWKEWGDPNKFFPVETRENQLVGVTLPEPHIKSAGGQQITKGQKSGKPATGKPSGGYVSCGG